MRSAGEAPQALRRRLRVARLVDQLAVERQGLIGAETPSLRSPRTDLQRLGARQLQGKLRGRAARRQEFVLNPSLVDSGGLDLRINAGACQHL